MSKILLIGLDGATFNLINPLIKKGKLPNLDKIIQKGVRGNLKSSLWPNSMPGWTSCFTGTSEGKNSIYSPFKRNVNSYKFKPVSSIDIKTLSIWDILSDQGYKNIVLNVPMTYPPYKIDGLLVSGMLTPSIKSNFTHPSTLKQELLEKIPDYKIETDRSLHKNERTQEFLKCINRRKDLSCYLLSKYNWDFAAIVFSTLDRVQHDFWADMDIKHPMHDENTEYSDFIYSVYEELDKAIGQLLQIVDSDTTLFVVSDHGFGSCKYQIMINTWLEKEGFLKYRNNVRRKLSMVYRNFCKRISQSISINSEKTVLQRKVASKEGFLDFIDWQNTKAYFGIDKGIWINLKGEYPKGIVDRKDYDRIRSEIQQGIMEIKSVDTKEKIFESVLMKEDFKGQYSHGMPDLFPILQNFEYMPNERMSSDVIKPWDSTPGTHNLYGILIVKGNSIKENKEIKGAELKDISPTILYEMGIPLTEKMDGKILFDIFKTSNKDITRKGSSYKQTQKNNGFTSEEEKIINKRLKELGYM